MHPTGMVKSFIAFDAAFVGDRGNADSMRKFFDPHYFS
jgi:hypothetical protein